MSHLRENTTILLKIIKHRIYVIKQMILSLFSLPLLDFKVQYTFKLFNFDITFMIKCPTFEMESSVGHVPC